MFTKRFSKCIYFKTQTNYAILFFMIVRFYAISIILTTWSFHFLNVPNAFLIKNNMVLRQPVISSLCYAYIFFYKNTYQQKHVHSLRLRYFKFYVFLCTHLLQVQLYRRKTLFFQAYHKLKRVFDEMVHFLNRTMIPLLKHLSNIYQALTIRLGD